MIKRGWMFLLILFVVAGFSGPAKAKLTVIGTATYSDKEYKLIYDDDQGLIWLDYSFPFSRWPQLVKQVNTLNNPGVITYSLNPGVSVSWRGGWRLPLSMDGSRKFGYDGTTTAGFNITTSEMGHLFYKSLGNLGYYDNKGPRPGWGKVTKEQEPWGLKKTGPFDNLQNANYWTGTEYSIHPQHAWDFNTYSGSLDCTNFKGSYAFLGLAVRNAAVDRR
jgi:hypothetical protein